MSDKPEIQEDTVHSISTARVLYGLSEGPILGPVNGLRSVHLDGTPIVDERGSANFDRVALDYVPGTNGQGFIEGFPAVENEFPVNTQLRNGNPWIREISNTDVNAVRITMRLGRLAEHTLEGDIYGTEVEYSISVRAIGEAWKDTRNVMIREKASAGYEKSHRINLPSSTSGWHVRVTRHTPDSDSDLLHNDTFVAAYTEIIDAKLRYPNTAMLALSYNGKEFPNLAKFSVDLKGKLIRVPSNYDPESRTYDGLWDGTFKVEYSNNPAWVYYDLLTQWRYGVGGRVTEDLADKWTLYSLAQFCDEPVDDGNGGTEPRFTCNVYLQKQEEAFNVLRHLAGIFRAQSFWNGEQVVLSADRPSDPVYTFTKHNVVNGIFSYMGTRARDRHTVVKVAWSDPNNNYKTAYEYIRNEAGIAKYGIRVLDLTAFGCTSRAQAVRTGRWALLTEQVETRQVNFETGLEGFIPQVGDIINVVDEFFAGLATNGKVSKWFAASNVIELDRPVDPDKQLTHIHLNTANRGVLRLRVLNADNTEENRWKVYSERDDVDLSTLKESEVVGQTWLAEYPDFQVMRFRILSISRNEDLTFNITGVQHDPRKYNEADFGFTLPPLNNIKQTDTRARAPDYVNIGSNSRVVQGQTETTVVISWGAVRNAASYTVEWRRNQGEWVSVPNTQNNMFEIKNATAGDYEAKVRAVSAFGGTSKATTSEVKNIVAKDGDVAQPTEVFAKGIMFGVELTWAFPGNTDDTKHTEVQMTAAPEDPGTTPVTMGQFGYPTDSYTLQDQGAGQTLYFRIRLADKLGNTSPWSDWVSAVTQNGEEKVLGAIQGKIGPSHLSSEMQDVIQSTKGDLVSVNASSNSMGDQDQVAVSIDTNGWPVSLDFSFSKLEIPNDTEADIPFSLTLERNGTIISENQLDAPPGGLTLYLGGGLNVSDDSPPPGSNTYRVVASGTGLAITNANLRALGAYKTEPPSP